MVVVAQDNALEEEAGEGDSVGPEGSTLHTVLPLVLAHSCVRVSVVGSSPVPTTFSLELKAQEGTRLICSDIETETQSANAQAPSVACDVEM